MISEVSSLQGGGGNNMHSNKVGIWPGVLNKQVVHTSGVFKRGSTVAGTFTRNL